ncbi:MAG: HU family DNA-binding protein [Candidatus Marinimicrobia bacterium]|jgi:nucleoid DNA-binding protein|nr:HU family DNA-binding protein [Candidatus Neomarinimicrobiota bacterium]MBT4731628.1 HU family DNA-binding protein [Candidatus Woesearchaeota archaeon]MBT3681778.1 HU family DNA-binding protein [Candidatus Neomarinimicrobiota bacterium]MBT3759504.1 HU family DNA-binding protein [Candidatus Neomarinimicrobiota bacterium]MBT3760764.1 HU family DNA-binding protein [Candidatus Neomarinimicrobiota bacterium]
MTKAEIISRVSQQTGMTKVETEVIFGQILETISNSLRSGERVDIRGFGNFYIKHRPERKAVNPVTRDLINLPERYVPVFKVSKHLKETVNKSLLRGF